MNNFLTVNKYLFPLFKVSFILLTLLLKNYEAFYLRTFEKID